MTLSVIVAVSENGIIGRGNGLPWHLPADLRRFRRITMGHAIIMGRKTWQSIGRPLPGRRSIVVSRDPTFAPDGARVVRSLDEALSAAAAERAGSEDDEVFVIGGQSLFELAVPRADRVYLTQVHAKVEGDVTFDSGPLDAFRLIEEQRHEQDEAHEYAYTFRVYEHP